MRKEKMKKIFLLIFVSIFLIGIVSASYCCEKTKAGAWCQPVDDKNDCDLSDELSASPTGCESTTYCKIGTCIDTKKGECSPNSPQKTCSGLWVDETISQIPQCEDICCILGTESFMDTIAGCKKQAEIFGLEVNFKKNLNQFECRALSATNVKGACVFDKDETTKTCQFKTEKECFDLKQLEPNVTFYRDTLCTATRLETYCVPSKKTKCSDGKVYFIDSCGNLANIYDEARQGDAIYWTNVFSEDEISCDDGTGNKNSANCGRCDDSAGSICGTPTTSTNPKMGDYICRDMSCKYNLKTYTNGAKWCAGKADGNKGVEDNLPGSEHMILECRDGKVSFLEDCSAGDWRNKICIDSVVAGVENAGCIVNSWGTCTAQTLKKDCLNTDQRDCLWVADKFGLEASRTSVKCVPKYAPGFDFWNENAEIIAACAVASKTVKLTYKKGLLTGRGFEWECDKNCWALDNSWINKMNKVCNAVGDCGSSVNYIGEDGWYTVKDLWSKK